MYSLVTKEDTAIGTVYADIPTYPYTVSTTANMLAGFGDVPPMRGHLIYMPATPDVQTLEVEIFRQLGCRFANNTIGHSFHHTPVAGTVGHETSLLESVQTISNNASAAFRTAVLDAASAYGAVTTVAKAVTSDVMSAGSALTSAMRMLK